MIGLGIDPGAANCAYSIQIISDDPYYSFLKESYLEKPELTEHGFLVKTHQFCKADYFDRSLLRQSVAEVLELVQRHGVDFAAFERWTPRPGCPVPSWVERVQFVLGALYYALPCKLWAIQASAWKKKFLTRYKIDSTRSFFGDELKTEHEADSALICAYVFEKNIRQDPPKIPRSKKIKL